MPSSTPVDVQEYAGDLPEYKFEVADPPAPFFSYVDESALGDLHLPDASGRKRAYTELNLPDASTLPSQVCPPRRINPSAAAFSTAFNTISGDAIVPNLITPGIPSPVPPSPGISSPQPINSLSTSGFGIGNSCGIAGSKLIQDQMQTTDYSPPQSSTASGILYAMLPWIGTLSIISYSNHSFQMMWESQTPTILSDGSLEWIQNSTGLRSFLAFAAGREKEHDVAWRVLSTFCCCLGFLLCRISPSWLKLDRMEVKIDSYWAHIERPFGSKIFLS
jgi:hypothetical protein